MGVRANHKSKIDEMAGIRSVESARKGSILALAAGTRRRNRTETRSWQAALRGTGGIAVPWS
jgi:hypothetical protein